MKAFKLYLKILKKTVVVIVINVVIFLFIAYMFSAPKNEPTNDFNETIISISFINRDVDSILINHLKTYLAKYVNYKDINEKDIADALYFREIYISFVVPQNFTEDFLSGKEVDIIQESIPNNVVNLSINRAINKYLNLVATYQKETDIALEDILEEVNKVLETETDAKKVIAYNNTINSAGFFYNYLSYLLFSILIFIVGFINIKIRRAEVKKRLIISSYPQTKFNLEIILANLIFAFIFTSLTIGLSFIFYFDGMWTINGLFFVLNAFCMSFTVLSISYFISLLVKSEQVLSAISNIVSLGTSFICGVFVPQWLLGAGILKIARLLPTYYFVYNNNLIVEMSDFNWNNTKTLLSYMGIQVLFGIVFIGLSIYTNKSQLQIE